MTLAQRLQTLNVALGLNVCRWRATHVAPWMQHLSWTTTSRQLSPPHRLHQLMSASQARHICAAATLASPIGMLLAPDRAHSYLSANGCLDASSCLQ